LKVVTALLLFVAAAFAQAPKIALVNIQEAIVGTTDAHDAEKQLDAQFGPRKAKLDAAQREIAAIEKQLEQPNLSDDDRAKLGQELETKTNAYDTETEKADADLKAAQDKVLKDLGPKMITVIAQYAKDHAYAVVFDISESEAPKLYAPNAVDITKEVAAAYEKKYAKK